MHYDSKSTNSPLISDIASRNVVIEGRTYCCTRDGGKCRAFAPNAAQQPATTSFAKNFATVGLAKAWMNRPSI